MTKHRQNLKIVELGNGDIIDPKFGNISERIREVKAFLGRQGQRILDEKWIKIKK
jgi:hypothetical protein